MKSQYNKMRKHFKESTNYNTSNRLFSDPLKQALADYFVDTIMGEGINCIDVSDAAFYLQNRGFNVYFKFEDEPNEDAAFKNYIRTLVNDWFVGVNTIGLCSSDYESTNRRLTNRTKDCLKESEEFTDDEITIPVTNLHQYETYVVGRKLYNYCDDYLKKNRLDAYIVNVDVNKDTDKLTLVYDIEDLDTTSHNQVKEVIRNAVAEYFNRLTNSYSDGVVNFSVPYDVTNLDEYDREQFDSLIDWCNDYLSECGLDAYITTTRHYQNELSLFYEIEDLDTTTHYDVNSTICSAVEDFFINEN